MNQAWAGFVVLILNLPQALLAWFAFPPVALPDEPEPMRQIANRVILGAYPRPFPPEPAQVAELTMLVGTKHDPMYFTTDGNINMETGGVISARVRSVNDRL